MSSRKHGKEKTYRRQIKPEYLDKYGIANVNEKEICVVCGDELANSSLYLSAPKLERHMKTHHSVARLAETVRKNDFRERYEAMCASQLNSS